MACADVGALSVLCELDACWGGVSSLQIAGDQYANLSGNCPRHWFAVCAHSRRLTRLGGE